MNKLLNSALNTVERIGNRLPDPATLFVILIGLVMLCSWLAAMLGISVTHPGTKENIPAINLFGAELLQRLLVEMPQTFASFPPLGMVLVVMLGIGVADKSGLIVALLRRFVSSTPRWLLSSALVFAGIMSSLAADAGYVVLIPLGAVLFLGAGRHPLAGIAATFAGVSGGFSANLLLTSLDPLLAGLTQVAARIIAPASEVTVTANYFFMAALTPLLTVLGAWITDKVVEPRLGQYTKSTEDDALSGPEAVRGESKALLAALAGLAVFTAIVAVMVLPREGILRDAEGGFKPFYQSLIALMFLGFLITGLIYGMMTGKIRNDRDAVTMSADSMADMAHYIVLAFLAAHFIALFTWSNLGLIIAISGAEALRAMEFTGLPLIISFIIVTMVINLFIGSASAKWAVMAPVFVPMLMLLGYTPELTQAAYRIGDSATNILTPLMPYFPLVIVFAKKYSRDFGIGTLVAMMLPYSIAFSVGATLLLIVWMLLGIPLGPGVEMIYSP
ncbi:MAG TPA: AbgT family transporter [Gammaproteobacteria bacterium]